MLLMAEIPYFLCLVTKFPGIPARTTLTPCEIIQWFSLKGKFKKREILARYCSLWFLIVGSYY